MALFWIWQCSDEFVCFWNFRSGSRSFAFAQIFYFFVMFSMLNALCEFVCLCVCACVCGVHVNMHACVHLLSINRNVTDKHILTITDLFDFQLICTHSTKLQKDWVATTRSV